MSPLKNPPQGPMFFVLLAELLIAGDTRMLRFWFGLTSIAFAAFISFGAPSHWEYGIAFMVLPHYVWSALLLVSGAALVYGAVTCHFDRLMLVLEGFIGAATWSALSITTMIAQGTIGAVTIAALINLYLLLRYPTWAGEKL